MSEKQSQFQPQAQPMKLVVLADLNVDPPEFDDEDTSPVLSSAPIPSRFFFLSSLFCCDFFN